MVKLIIHHGCQSIHLLSLVPWSKSVKGKIAKWKNMCKVADDGGRPIYRPREWRRKERRLAKESKKQTWHKSKDHVQVSAPLILDPIPGPLIEQMKAE